MTFQLSNQTGRSSKERWRDGERKRKETPKVDNILARGCPFEAVSRDSFNLLREGHLESLPLTAWRWRAIRDRRDVAQLHSFRRLFSEPSDLKAVPFLLSCPPFRFLPSILLVLVGVSPTKPFTNSHFPLIFDRLPYGPENFLIIGRLKNQEPPVARSADNRGQPASFVRIS